MDFLRTGEVCDVSEGAAGLESHLGAECRVSRGWSKEDMLSETIGVIEGEVVCERGEEEVLERCCGSRGETNNQNWSQVQQRQASLEVCEMKKYALEK